MGRGLHLLGDQNQKSNSWLSHAFRGIWETIFLHHHARWARPRWIQHSGRKRDEENVCNEAEEAAGSEQDEDHRSFKDREKWVPQPTTPTILWQLFPLIPLNRHRLPPKGQNPHSRNRWLWKRKACWLPLIRTWSMGPLRSVHYFNPALPPKSHFHPSWTATVMSRPRNHHFKIQRNSVFIDIHWKFN